MRLLLIRHAESTWNREGRYTGWADPPLTRRGERQAEAIGYCLRDKGLRPDVVHVSGLTRAVRTAELLLQALDAAELPLRTHPGLNERRFGALEGATKSEVAARWGNDLRKRWRDDPGLASPGGESRLAAEERMLQAWHRDVLPDVLGGRRALVVAHAGTLRAILAHLGRPIENVPHGRVFCVPAHEAVCCVAEH